MKLEEALDKGALNGLMRGLARGRYHALLGAGASVGGMSRDGRPLPLANQFASELAHAFGLGNAAQRMPLARIYELAEKRVTSKGESLEKYVKDRFTGTTSPQWMRRFVSIPWAHTWTLNVDDALEAAYRSHSNIARQTDISLSWTERHRVARDSRNEMLLVHLHGKASNGARDLVFDISGYLGALETRHRWHRIFGDVYGANPFIVIGASLDLEIDLDQILRQGQSRKSEHPSIVVVKDCDDLQAEIFSNYGLKVIKSDAEGFFEGVAELMPSYLSELTHGESNEISSVSPQAQVFLHEWRELDNMPWPRRSDKSHQFYAGHEPTWRDVLDDLPFRRSTQSGVIDAVTRNTASGESVITLIAGDAFSGKSSLLLAAADELRGLGWRPFYFDADVSPDRTAMLSWVTQHPKTVLVIDNATDFVTDIESVVRTAREGIAGARFLIADRNSQLPRLRKVLYESPLVECRIDVRLRDREITAMLAKLDANRRLGILQNLREKERIDYVKKVSRRSLFEAMASLENGRGFRDRIKQEWNGLENEADRSLLGVASIAASAGYPVPLELLRAATGMTSTDADHRISTTRLHDLMVVREGRLSLRHRGVGEHIAMTCVPVEERLDYARQLILALAPHVTPAAISANTLAYRIARSLMARRFAQELASKDADRALELFADVESAYDWNARFWEQRALLAADAGSYEEAYSWSQVAVSRRRDAYSLNTVGTVLMRRAVWESAPGHWPEQSYEMAVEALRAARELEGVDAEYPYETFFEYTLRLVEKVHPKDAGLCDFLNSTWIDWQIASLGLSAGVRNSLGRSVLENAQSRWDQAMVD